MIQTDNTTFFAQPKFIVGLRALEHLHIELDGYNAKRPMVITNGQNKKEFFKHFKRSLAESNVTISALYDETAHYVNLNEVERLSGLYLWRKCDSIIAIGGESVLDTAKALAIAVTESNNLYKMEIQSSLVPLIYIATPYLNGLEVTNTVNIDGKIHISDFFYPEIVCIDNRMVLSKDSQETLIYAALDSLAICIEGASNDPSNPFINASAFTAIRLIAENFPTLIKKPRNKKAAIAIINGITIASSVRSNTKGSLACLSAEVIAKEMGYPMGMISGFLLPLAIKFKRENKMEIRDDLLLSLCGIDKFCDTPAESKIDDAIKALDQINSLSLKYLPKNLKSLNLQEHLLSKIAIKVEELSNSKIKMESCLSFLRLAYDYKTQS